MKLELELGKMVHGGRSLARLEGGRIALVSGGIPGETVEAEVGEKSGVLQGHVVQVLRPSEARVAASDHPGLDYSHIAYRRQLELKREVVADALARAAGVSAQVLATVAAPAPWGYRHAVQPALTPAGLGYRQPGSGEVVVLERDPVAHESINEGWALWRGLQPPKRVHELVWRCNSQGGLLLCLVSSAPAAAFQSLADELVGKGLVGVSHAPFDARGRFRRGIQKLAGRRFLLQRYGEVEVSVSATSFAQPNPAAAGLLFSKLQELAGGGRHAVDLYAGSGVIAMHLARRFEEVTAIEVDIDSIKRGIQDVRRLGIGNVEFVRGDIRKLQSVPDADLVTVDPPRAGLAKGVRQAIAASQTRRLIYASCDAATWARDIADLLGMGFELELIEPYDFYPQTHHVEILSLLTR